MHKHLLFKAAAREKILKRASALADAVRATLGPKSKCILIQKKWGKPVVCDAIAATKAAVAEGIVPGGGLTLIRAAHALQAEENSCQGDERTGVQIMRRALEVPTCQIAENSGFDAGVVAAQMRNGQGNFGLDTARGEYVDLVEAGIIDPAKVVRMAIENAVSVSSTLLLTEGAVTEAPEPKEGEGDARAPMAG